MGVTNTNKELSKESINFFESFNIKLSLLSELSIATNSTDFDFECYNIWV